MAETNDIRRAETYYFSHPVVRNVPSSPWQTPAGTAVIHFLPGAAMRAVAVEKSESCGTRSVGRVREYISCALDFEGGVKDELRQCTEKNTGWVKAHEAHESRF